MATAGPLSRCLKAYPDDLNCNPCSYGNSTVRATHFCRTCEDPEPLCENCSTQHVRQKMTRHHKICENIKEFPNKHTNRDEDSHLKELPCGPCSFENVQAKGEFFCQICENPEPLCETCAAQHTRQKLTRGHKIGKDIWKYFKLQSILGIDSKKEEDIECEPCLNDNQKITATHFCKTCEDPEPLCDICAKQHARQKAFRDHELSRNIREFKKHASNTSVYSQQEEYVLCEPCIHDGEKETAIYFCKTCEDPEALCEICAKQHTRQKAFKEHELCGNIHEFSKQHPNKSVDSQQDVYIECQPC